MRKSDFYSWLMTEPNRLFKSPPESRWKERWGSGCPLPSEGPWLPPHPPPGSLCTYRLCSLLVWHSVRRSQLVSVVHLLHKVIKEDQDTQPRPFAREWYNFRNRRGPWWQKNATMKMTSGLFKLCRLNGELCFPQWKTNKTKKYRFLSHVILV